jgi:hypothetical protein
MDLRNFKESSRPAANKAGFTERTFTRVKQWFLPPTSDKRKERFGQYRDFAIFVGAVGVVSYFQDNISKFLEIETDPSKLM